jgi:group I intron endonuclease
MIRIYKITNTFLLPNKIYIGQTNKTLEKRLDEHFRMGRKGVNRELCIDLIYYGKINFTIELLEEVLNDDSFSRENHYIKFYNSHYKDGYGYNMRYEDLQKNKSEFTEDDITIINENKKNGDVWNKNINMSKYTSEKISASLKEKYNSGWINPSWGHKHSDETKNHLGNIKRKYYENNRPHNVKMWKIEYTDGKKHETDQLLKFLGGKSNYNRITKWCRSNPGLFHPKLNMRVYCD